MKQAWLIYFYLILSLGSFSQVDVNDQCKQAYQDILSLRFDAAESKLAKETVSNPNNLYVPYLENYIDFLTIFIGEDESQFKKLENNKSVRINQIKKLSDTSRFKNYMLGNIHLQWAVARLKFKEYFTAAVEINKAYRLLEKNAEMFPEFVPNKISLGVLHIMIGMVPDKYQWLLNIISMEGSVVQGREELNHVLDQSTHNKIYSYLKVETLFYLGFVDINIKTDTIQLEFVLSELQLNRKDNLLLTYLTINILMRSGKNSEALEIMDEPIDTEEYFPFYFMDYLAGECHMHALETEKAFDDYQTFLSNFTGRNYIKDALRKKAWISLLSQDTVNYFSFMEKVIEEGNDDVDVDKEALKEAKSKDIPNIELLKSRLFFDGGYYKKTDSLLAKIDTTTLDTWDKVERIYRLGRSAQQQGNVSNAILLYKRTIVNGSDLNKYFAGNSALKLGEIYEDENDFSNASFYYHLCLDLDFDEYENSIHSKAKAGLERLEKD